MIDESSRVALFARVSELGSFSETARQMNRSASAVNRQISALEDQLGVSLFRRSTRQLVLTEAGQTFLRYAQRIAAELEEAERAVGRLQDSPTGHLRVTAPLGLALVHLSPLLPRFFERYPEVSVGLVLSDSVVDVVSQRIDLAIRFGWLPDSGLQSRRLAMSSSAVCASPAYLSSHPPILDPSDLKEHNCLSFRTSPGASAWCFMDGKIERRVQVQGNLQMNSGLGLVNAARAGMGVVMLPGWHVAGSIASGELTRVLEDYSLVPPHTPVSAVFAPERYLAPKLRVFVDFLSEEFAKQPW